MDDDANAKSRGKLDRSFAKASAKASAAEALARRVRLYFDPELQRELNSRQRDHRSKKGTLNHMCRSCLPLELDALRPALGIGSHAKRLLEVLEYEVTAASTSAPLSMFVDPSFGIDQLLQAYPEDDDGDVPNYNDELFWKSEDEHSSCVKSDGEISDFRFDGDEPDADCPLPPLPPPADNGQDVHLYSYIYIY